MFTFEVQPKLKISVIITTYNRADDLKHIISSVKRQTFSDYEIIIADDCSTDHTPSVAEIFPEAVYLKTKENSGYSKNCLNALEHAQGKYVIFLSDDDDLICDTFFEEALTLFDNNPEVDSVFGRVKTVSGENSYISDAYFKEVSASQELLKRIMDLRFTFLDYFSFSSFIFDKELFMKTEPFKALFPEAGSVDISAIIKYLLISDKVGFVDKPVYLWVKSLDGSLSGSRKDDLAYQIIQSVSAAFDIEDFCGDNQECGELLNSYMMYIFDAILSDYRYEQIRKGLRGKLTVLEPGDVYIYGKGWFGLALQAELEEIKYVNFRAFIDDYKKEEKDTISFQTFKDSNPSGTVIISSLKYKDAYRMYRLLSDVEGITVADMFEDGDYCVKNSDN